MDSPAKTAASKEVPGFESQSLRMEPSVISFTLTKTILFLRITDIDAPRWSQPPKMWLMPKTSITKTSINMESAVRWGHAALKAVSSDS